ncbi:MAG: hypothetical protein ACJ8HI_08445 [Massilia sp.]
MLAPPTSWRRVLLRERRLLLLCGASALAHALVLGLLARSQPRLQKSAPAPALTVALRGGAQAAPAALAGAAAAGADRALPPRPLPPPPLSRSLRPAATAAVQAASPRAQDDAAVTLPARAGAGWDVQGEGSDSSAPHLPGMQAVQPPPPARLAYAVTRQADARTPGGSSSGGAFLDWRPGDGGYRLTLGGAGSALGAIESSGQMADGGFVPLQTRADDGAVRFDWAAASASFSRDAIGAIGNSAAMVGADAQDRASMLMRLAGIGLGGAVQLDRPVELQVAGSAGVATVVFERVLDEQDGVPLATALGPLETVHLRQKCSPRQACLDVWLAPQRNWLPVQLRLTGADGSVTTQTVTAIEAPP